jgi:ribose transport system substrate-binding protein
VRVVEIPVATFGNKGPTIVVDDLLAHPKTTSAVFAVGEQAIGLPSALKTADIKLPILLFSPDPSVLSSIQDRTYTAGLGIDLDVLTWTMVDSLARLTTGQAPAEGARKDELVREFVTAKNLTGDVSHGWSGYPDFIDRFKTLWSAAK